MYYLVREMLRSKQLITMIAMLLSLFFTVPHGFRYWRLRETSNSRDIDMYLAAKTFRTLRVGLVVDL